MQRSLLAILLLAGFLAGAVSLSYFLFREGTGGEPAAAIPAGVSAALVIPSLPALLSSLSRTRMAPAPGGNEWALVSEILSELLEGRGIFYEPDASRLAKSLRGGAALGWIPGEQRGSPAQVVLALEMPSASGDFLATVEQVILPHLAGGAAVTTRRAHRGHEYLVVRIPGASSVLCVTSFRRIALMTFSRDAMRRSLSTLMRRDGALISAPAFRAIRRDLGKRSDLTAYVSGAFVRELFAPQRESAEAPKGWRRAIASTEAIQGAGVSITVDGEGLFRERVRVLVPDLSETLLGMVFGSRPAPIETASLLPAGYPFYLGASFSHSEAVWERLSEWLGPVTGQDPAHLRERLLGLQEFLGLDIRRDLLGVMGDELALAFDHRPGKPFVLALNPGDAAGARRLLGRLDGLARAAEAYHESTSPAGRIVTYDYPRLAPLRPSYLFADSALLIAGAPDPLSRAAPASAHPFLERPAHIAAMADTEQAISWIREIAGGGEASGRSIAWLRRLRDLLPGASGPLPPLMASFNLTRDGITGEWSAPVSPVILTTLLLASPGEGPDLHQEILPPPEEPQNSEGLPELR